MKKIVFHLTKFTFQKRDAIFLPTTRTQEHETNVKFILAPCADGQVRLENVYRHLLVSAQLLTNAI